MAQIYPVQILITSLAGWMNRRQGEILECLVEEDRVLKEQLKGRALRLNDDQRRRLAAKGKRIGRRLLMPVATIVTPDTILRWHRQLIAAKWTYTSRRVGRPGLMKEIRKLILRFARVNCEWGYCHIEGALRNVGHRVAPTTIRKVLKEHGIKPAPERPVHGLRGGACDDFLEGVSSPHLRRRLQASLALENRDGGGGDQADQDAVPGAKCEGSCFTLHLISSIR